jgi:superfamily II DNA or RNA helicase
MGGYVGSSAIFQITSWQQLADHFPGIQPIADLELSEDIEFRSYQAAATTTAIFSGFRGVVRAATGSGKTLISAAICGAMLPKRSVIMIHGRELVSQTYKTLTTYLGKETVGVISTDEFNPKAITIASIDTFSFYMGKLPVNQKTRVPIMDPKEFERLADKFANYLENEIDMLVFDEVHHGSADTWQAIGKYSKAYYRVGLSGTPLKQDVLSDMLMMSLVGPVIFDLNAPWLQREGYLAEARLEIRTLDYTTPKTRGLKWQDAKKKLLVENTERTAHIAGDIAQDISAPETRLLVLTGNSVDIAENLEEELIALARPLTRKLGYRPFVMITGKTNPRKVSKAFKDLRTGDVRCVITTKLADEGIDVPNINLLYLVGGGKAYVSTVQRIGRGLRVKDGGEELLVVDYFTRGNKYLEKHDRKRLKTYEEEAFFKEVTTHDVG